MHLVLVGVRNQNRGFGGKKGSGFKIRIRTEDLRRKSGLKPGPNSKEVFLYTPSVVRIGIQESGTSMRGLQSQTK